MKSESFRKQALCLVLFLAAVAAVFALTRLRSDPAKKQAEFVVQQLLSCSSAVEQAVDAAAPSGSEPGLAAVDTDGLYAFLPGAAGRCHDCRLPEQNHGEPSAHPHHRAGRAVRRQAGAQRPHPEKRPGQKTATIFPPPC